MLTRSDEHAADGNAASQWHVETLKASRATLLVTLHATSRHSSTSQLEAA
jgi:hypothetical protein